MDFEKAVARFADLAPHEWRELAVRTSWCYRTDVERPFPPEMLAAFGGKPPTPDEFQKLCRAIRLKRRADRYSVRKHAIDQRREKRRLYMRRYMQTRREKERKNA